MMETFRQMVNECVRIGLGKNVSTLKQLIKLSYKELAKYDITSYYKLYAISHAAGILANRKKTIKRGLQPRQPYATKPLLIACTGFRIVNGILKAPLGDRKYFDIPLNSYVRCILSDSSLKVRSLTMTCDNTVSIAISKEVAMLECTDIEGMDRNLYNVTIGNCQRIPTV
jgi:putative transposase